MSLRRRAAGSSSASSTQRARRADATRHVLALGVRCGKSPGRRCGRHAGHVALQREERRRCPSAVPVFAEHHLLHVRRGAEGLMRDAVDRRRSGSRPRGGCPTGLEHGRTVARRGWARRSQRERRALRSSGGIAREGGATSARRSSAPRSTRSCSAPRLRASARTGRARRSCPPRADGVRTSGWKRRYGTPRRSGGCRCARPGPRQLAVRSGPGSGTVVHHPRHRTAAPLRTRRAAGSRCRRGACRRPPLERRQVGVDPRRRGPRGSGGRWRVLDAGLGGDREALGDRQAEAGHLRDVGALAPQQVAHVARSLGEVVDPLDAHTSVLLT